MTTYLLVCLRMSQNDQVPNKHEYMSRKQELCDVEISTIQYSFNSKIPADIAATR